MVVTCFRKLSYGIATYSIPIIRVKCPNRIPNFLTRSLGSNGLRAADIFSGFFRLTCKNPSLRVYSIVHGNSYKFANLLETHAFLFEAYLLLKSLHLVRRAPGTAATSDPNSQQKQPPACRFQGFRDQNGESMEKRPEN